MKRNHKMYKNNILLSVLILFCIKIWNVQCQTILLHSHKTQTFDDFDITTLYRITNSSIFNTDAAFNNYSFLETYKGDYSIEIHSKANGIGMPLQVDDNILSSNGNELFKDGSFMNNSLMIISYFHPPTWEKQRVKLNGYNCEFDKHDYYDRYGNLRGISDIEQNITGNYCYTALEYRYDRERNYWKNNKMLSLIVTPDRNLTCLTITYTHRMISFMDIDISIIRDNDSDNDTLITVRLEKKDDLSTLKIVDLNLIKDTNYHLVFNQKVIPEFDYRHGHGTYRGIWFGLHRIALCSKYDEDNIQTVFIEKLDHHPKPFNVIGKENPVEREEDSMSKKLCQNGGFTLPNKLQCTCPPGFTGQFCSKACGPNSYGTNCKGVCAMHPSKMCRGVLMCTKIIGCTCPPGLTGPLCNDDCALGKYGNNCTQTCSSNCLNSECNAYTGACSLGCKEGYIAPTCQKKYPYLINPPSLRSNNFGEIQITVDFKSSNIVGGDDKLKMKYYALSYKKLNEIQFLRSQLKTIDENIDVTHEILSSLTTDTKYKVGVLLIMEDGNFNDQDVAYGEFKTSCTLPKITDYNIQITSQNKSATISWKKFTPKRLECNIIGYLLTLTYHKSQNHTSGVQEVHSSLENSYTFEDLYPGHQYSVFLTPQTTEGLLPSSSTYHFSTHSTVNDVKVKDIVTTTVKKTIDVKWKLTSLFDDDESTINKPVTCIVKYKIKRSLSCSLEETSIQWMSVELFNSTQLNIGNIEYNSQYIITIGVNGSQNVLNEITVNTLTPPSEPEIEPTIDQEHPMIITNHSAFIQWKFDFVQNCLKLNGVFLKFRVELKDINSNELRINETELNHFTFDQLKSNTSYELKVFIQTHVGYNVNHSLITNFTTKTKMLHAVQNLAVYKKSQNNSFALRWSYSEDNKFERFIVSVKAPDQQIKKEDIPLTKCSAWPKYYCYTFENIFNSNNYTFEVRPKSNDYPDGGEQSWIFYENVPGIPDSPTNLVATEINSMTVKLQWDIPLIFNGNLKSFFINVQETSSVDQDSCCNKIVPIDMPIKEELPTYNYTVNGLKPGSTYSFAVSTISNYLYHSSFPPIISVKTNMDE